MRPRPTGYAANEGGSGGFGGGGGTPSAVVLGLTRPTATPTATEPTANRLLTNNRLIVRFICFLRFNELGRAGEGVAQLDDA